MKNEPLPRLDLDAEIRAKLLPYCRLKEGDIWEDPVAGHRIGCVDAADSVSIQTLMNGSSATLAIHDPPYNLVAFEERSLDAYVAWCRRWIENTQKILSPDASLYLWLGADQNDGFQPLADLIILMRTFASFHTRSFLTMRNQRGYGTQKNWMAVRQELLYYIQGTPVFHVEAEYTDIPKILRGYYKEVGGKQTENIQRSHHQNIRAGNVWVDIQQVFYRMEENVSGCYAQKPLKSIERIIQASSSQGDVVVDFFSHSGTTLLAAEIHQRRYVTAEIDPIFCEMTIRRLEHFRRTGKLGWQNGNAFESELALECQKANVHTERKGNLSPSAQTFLF